MLYASDAECVRTGICDTKNKSTKHESATTIMLREATQAQLKKKPTIHIPQSLTRTELQVGTTMQQQQSSNNSYAYVHF
jgi:hypothetical protein